ncbi:hypothetical protein [Pseudomonas sp. KNUC1026]|uniref:hypothetical protein n=1 Tax=Pseudomonas sp. KNUC1026 TaxID=2893890 RepID=UPI001F2EC02C|nr:hypothetical protein [Pseudomonas sp. KNUC1026]UFH51458.1 hypothetical protein LN139_10970 [Pseudomonas sp. KNUC1026]
MTNSISVFKQVLANATLAGEVTKRFAGRPVLFTWAVKWLDEVLEGQLAPGLSSVDLWLATPVYADDETQEEFRGYDLNPLPWVLIDGCLRGTPLDLVAGWHLITDQPGAEQPRQLALDIDRIGQLINEGSVAMEQEYPEALVDWWCAADAISGQSPWAWLAEHLRLGFSRDALLGQALTVERAAELVQLIDQGQARDIGILGLEGALGTLPMPDALEPCVLLRQADIQPGWQKLVLWSPSQGAVVFQTWQRLADYVAAAMPQGTSELALSLACRQPAGDLFDSVAVRVLELQIERWKQLLSLARRERFIAPTLDVMVDQLTGLLNFDRPERHWRGKRIARAIPGWLGAAGDQGRCDYAEGLGRLALSRQAAGADWLDGIDDLDSWTAQRLQAALAVDWPGQTLPAIEDLDLRLVTVPNALLSIVNAGDHAMEEQSISLVRLAQMNRAGRPRGILTLQRHPGQALPAGFDRDYIEALVQKVDVGAGYLAMLRSHLQGASAQVEQRRQAFACQWLAQLPLLAMEYALQGKHGFDTETARLLTVALGLAGDCRQGAAFSALTLAAAPGRDDRPLAVFVIGPRDGGEGARVLYTPLNECKLQAFASWAALEAAVREQGTLQRLLIDWLPEEVRVLYANGGLAEPHVVRFGQGSEFSPLSPPAPASIGEHVLAGPPALAVYDALVAALVQVADRRTVSNEENRWLSYRLLAQALFGAVLPLLSGPVGVAGWMMQGFAELRDFFQAQESDDQQAASQAWTELMFDVAFFLFTEALHLPMPWLKAASDERLAAPEPQPVGRARIDVGAATIEPTPHAPLGDVDFGWATSRVDGPLFQALRAMRQPIPAHAGSPAPYGRAAGLYVDGTALYARLVEGEFQVAYDDSGNLRVVDPANPQAPGPRLTRDRVGRWVLDLRLRLLGGSDHVQALEAQRDSARAQANYLSWHQNIERDFHALDRTVELINNVMGSEQPHRESQLRSLHENYDARVVRLLDEVNRVAAQLTEAHRGIGVRGYQQRMGYVFKMRIMLEARRANNRKVQLNTLAKAERDAGALTGERFESDAYGENLAYRLSLVEQVLASLARIDVLMDELAQVPRFGIEYRQALEPQLSLLPSAIAVQRLHLPMLSLRAMRPAVSAMPELVSQTQAALSNALLALNQMADAIKQEDALVGSTSTVAEQLIAANTSAEAFDQAANTFNAAADALAFSAQGAAQGILDAHFDALVQQVTALGEEARSRLSVVLERELRLRRAMRKRTAKEQRRQGREQNRLPPRSSAPRQHASQLPPPQSSASAPGPQQQPLNAVMERLSINAPSPDLNALMQRGRARLAASAGLVQRVRSWVDARRVPVEMEELLTGPAAELESLARQMEAVEPGSPKRLAALCRDLREGAAGLREAGRQARIETSLLRLPTGDSLAWLLGQRQVSIQPLGPLHPLRARNGEGDALREARIDGPEGQPLWYAHFHYDDGGRLVAAHLKTAAQRRDGLGKQLQQAEAGEPVVAIWRSRLSEAQVRQMFPQALEPQQG